jgi:cell division protein FtsW
MRNWLRQNLKGDPVIWTIILMLSIISILVVYSATGTLAFKKMGGDTEAYLRKHAALMLLSLVVMYLAHRIDYRYYARISRLLLLISIPLLLFSFFFGTKLNDASRWITIPFIRQSFQPSDLAKLALIANLASMLAKRQQNIGDFKQSLVPVLAWVGVICGLIVLSNFSTGFLLLVTCLLVMYIGRVPVKYLGALVLVGLLGISIALFAGQRWKTFVSRIDKYTETVFNPQSPKVPFQAQQGYIAIATGGVTGKGVGKSEQRNILPHPYSDFIFAIIIEEYGLLGGLFVVFLYLALLYRSMLAVSRTDRAFGGLLSAGLSFSLVIQAFINMGVAVGLLPITGQPLPLLSMGGTSLIFTGLAIGIILSVSRGEIKEKVVG